MIGLVKLMGIVMVVSGAIYLVKPKVCEQVKNFWVKGNRLYLGGALSLLIGIIFLLAAWRCALPWFIMLVGIISLAKGILIFSLRKKFIPLMEKITKGPTSTVRLLGAVALALGILLIYAA
ncbi:MAG: hypothetical protein JSW40_08755 [Candidatus Omnitrophota bacterium]|nr:MAG: hypothetical protein JSW40_08755 [Candidatus Omnitrophota bacterium]